MLKIKYFCTLKTNYRTFTMKKITLLALVAIAIVSCSKVGKNEFLISGTTPKDIADGTAVYLQKQDSTGQLVYLDTVKIKAGKFEFKNKFDNKKFEQGIALVEVAKIQGKVAIILESGAITIDVKKDTIGKSKIGGTFSNDQLMKYSQESEKINKRMMAFQNVNMAKFQEAQAKKDTTAVNALMKENSVFQKDFENLSMSHMEKNPKSFLSLYFLQQFLATPTADKVKLKNIYDALDADLKATKIGKKLAKELGAAK